MAISELLGRVCKLRVLRIGGPGAFLGSGPEERETVLLPRLEVPADAAVGDELGVFVYLDSDDRPIATTTPPRLAIGEVTFLEVKDVGPFGAFMDWGLMKELLVPFAEQTRDVRVGERHAVGLYVDDTGRLAGTMRVAELLAGTGGGEFELDEWVAGEAWRKDDAIGLFVIVERSVVGLLPPTEPHALKRGEKARFRVSNILPDGKIELSLRGHAHEELAGDASRVLAVLARPSPPRIGDGSSPDDIRAVFGLSKKAFKRAVGRLLKDGAVRIDAQGCVVVVP